jgi:hypothetical protein
VSSTRWCHEVSLWSFENVVSVLLNESLGLLIAHIKPWLCKWRHSETHDTNPTDTLLRAGGDVIVCVIVFMLQNATVEVAPSPHTEPVPASQFRVVCDNMVQGLGKMLRKCGIDTAILRNEDNHDVCVRIASQEHRVIVTRGLVYNWVRLTTASRNLTTFGCQLPPDCNTVYRVKTWKQESPSECGTSLQRYFIPNDVLMVGFCHWHVCSLTKPGEKRSFLRLGHTLEDNIKKDMKEVVWEDAKLLWLRWTLLNVIIHTLVQWKVGISRLMTVKAECWVQWQNALYEFVWLNTCFLVKWMIAQPVSNREHTLIRVISGAVLHIIFHYLASIRRVISLKVIRLVANSCTLLQV